MRDPKQNVIIIALALVSDFSKKIKQSWTMLLAGKSGTTSGMTYSILDHILQIGPSTFQKYPRAISIGRGLISPLVLLFSKK